MEKLTIEHLAPYLPYKLRIKRGERNLVMNMGKGSSTHWVGISAVIDWQNSTMISKPFPILRPMSDLDIDALKIIYPNTPNFDFLISTKNTKDYHFKNLSNSTVEYCIMKYCFENHFDVFGLIDKGLAIDINTLAI